MIAKFHLIPLGPIVWAPAFLTRSTMSTEHVIEILFLIFVLGLGLGYGCRGLWNRLLHKLRGPVYSNLNDVKARLLNLYNSAETDAAKLKAEVQSVITFVEKLLPLK